MDIQNSLQPIIDVIKKIIPLKEAYLFGSFAYGKPNNDSDYDIYLIADSIEGSHHEKLVSIYGEVQKFSDRPTDFLLNTKENFDERKEYKGTLEYKVANEGVRLYEEVI